MENNERASQQSDPLLIIKPLLHIGQGITGMSTLAFGSLISLVSIIFGSALMMKLDYYLMDDSGFFGALRHALADMRLFPKA